MGNDYYAPTSTGCTADGHTEAAGEIFGYTRSPASTTTATACR